MRAVLLLFLFGLFSPPLPAQKEEHFVLQLHDAEFDKKALPFGTIQIIDARFEQGNIGVVAKALSFKGATENKMTAVFPEPLRAYLPKVFSSLFSLGKEGNDTLVIVVKQLRIADYLSNTIDKHLEPASVLTYSWSFYKGQNGRLYKLFSDQGVLVEKWKSSTLSYDESATELRKEAIRNLLLRPFENKSWTPSTVSFSLVEVQSGLRKRFQLPILTDSVLNGGVYKNFQEFLSNAPSLTEFKIGKSMDEIKEVRDKNSNLLERNTYWGLCDGKQLYINFLGHMYPLYLVNNSFCIVYSRVDNGRIIPIGEEINMSHSTKLGKVAYSPVALINLFRKNTRPELLYLNMETGAIHIEELVGDNDVRKLRTWF